MEKLLTNSGLYYVTEKIFLRLDLNSLLNCCLISKTWKAFVTRPEMWLLNFPKSHILGGGINSIWINVPLEITKSLDDMTLKSKLGILLMELYHFSKNTKSSHFYLIYPLVMAFKKNNFTLVSEILTKVGSPKYLKFDQDPSKLDHVIMPPRVSLHVASSNGYIEIAKMMMKVLSLQDYRVCYNYENEKNCNRNAIEVAAKKGHFEVVEMFLSYGIPQKKLLPSLVFAIVQKDYELTRLLLEHLNDFSFIYTLQVLKKDFNHSDDVNRRHFRKTIFEHAYDTNDEEMISLIMSLCNPPSTPISFATLWGEKIIADLIYRAELNNPKHAILKVVNSLQQCGKLKIDAKRVYDFSK